jgi:hypothetical protein
MRFDNCLFHVPLTVSLFVFLAAVSPVRADKAQVTVASILSTEFNPSMICVAPAAGISAQLYSSYDRTGGNGDSQNFYAMNGTTGVMADVDGPGAVVRLWSPNPNGELKIYIDGSATPIIDTDMPNFFSAKFAPFTGSLTATTSGGVYTYLPIPFAKHCLITVDHPSGLYYQVGVQTYPPGTEVQSFSLPLGDDATAAVTAVENQFDHPDVPTYAANAESSQSDTLLLGAGGEKAAKVRAGSAVIDSLVVNAAGLTDEQLRKVVIKITFDGHRQADVEAPLADFFGSAFGHRTFDALYLAQTDAGDMTCRLPMPFGKTASIAFSNGNDTAVTLTMTTKTHKKPFKAGTDMYLRASFNQEQTVVGKPHLWLHADGQTGRFIGVVQAMDSHGIGFLEGDDQIRVDDQQFQPCKVQSTVIGPWNGTGTEDFFNSGWYFDRGEMVHPLSGCLVKHDAGQIDAYRFFGADAPVFTKSIDAQIEHEGVNEGHDDYYSSVAYWYGAGTAPEHDKIDASSMALPKNNRPSLNLAAPGATVIEGESMVKGAHATAGNTSDQGLGDYAGAWSNGEQLFWSGGQKQGDTVTLTFAGPKAGSYQLVGYFTQAADYGIVTLTLNGQVVGSPFDGYHNGVVNSGPVSLGTVNIPDGKSTLVVTVTGKNDLSTNYFFGLDALVLKAQ